MSTQPSIRNQYALLQYYLREKLWRHAETIASDISGALNDYTFRVWKAFALDMQGQGADALREYKQCETHRDAGVAALAGMRLIYQRNNDTAGVNAMTDAMSSSERRGQLGGWLQAAAILFHAGDSTRAREVINQVLDQDQDYRDEYTSVQLVRGWIDLTSGRGAYIEKCNAMFERVISSEGQQGLMDIDAIMGKVAYLERKNQFWPAQEMLNKCIVQFPFFTPALVIKAKQLMKAEDWDQAAEITQRILAKDHRNVEAIILAVLYLLVKEARHVPAATNIGDLLKALDARENRNAHLFFTCSQCFARLCGGNLQILALTKKLVDLALQLQPNNADYLSEAAFQQLLCGELKSAHATYKKASTVGDGSVVPLMGLIKCTILAGKLEDAQQQVDFLTEIQTPQTRNPELLFLTAMLRWRKDRNQAGSLEKLDQAVEAHRQEIATQPTGMDLYIKLNPPMMLEIAREFLQHCRTEPPENGQAKHDPVAEKTRRVLDMLLRHVPSNTEAQLLNARILFVSGDTEKAMASISACIRQDHSQPEAHLLCAQIYQYIGNLPAASQSLEQALSLNFDIRDQPQYNLLRGIVHGAMGDNEKALEHLQHGLKLVSGENGVANANKAQLSVNDHVSLYLQLAQTYLKMRRGEAIETIHEAARVFRDTNQMGRVSIAHALVVARTDVDNALGILRSVPPKSDYFLQAKAHMAQMYLTQKHNRVAFARCYEELVEAFPSAQSYSHLGEAYASIQEPEKAIVAFEKARALDPNNADLAIRIGRTLVTTHDYQRALRYYRDALAADGSKFSLRQDLAMLYWKLGDLERSIGVLKESPNFNKPANNDDLPAAIERVNVALLMAKIFKNSGAQCQQQFVEALIQARVYQIAVLNKMRGETPETVQAQRQIAAMVCLELGEQYSQLHNNEKALGFYNEALKHDEVNDRAMLCLAKLYLSKGDVDACEHQCNTLLRINPACEEATMILADIMFRKNRYEDAAFHFLQILDKKPDNFSAMVQYVQLLRRAGHLSEATAVFEAAEKLRTPGQRQDPGFCFAKGLYHRYTNNSREALKELNMARLPRDNPWSQKATIAMIEVYIMPDNENLWEDQEDRGEVEDNIATAEKLLKDVKDEERAAILEAYCLVATKRKDNLERALAMFYDMMTAGGGADAAALKASATAADMDNAETPASPAGEKVNVPALVGMATTLQIMKQTPKARNHLKRVAKANYNPAEDDDYERGWLLLADIYIQNGKYDLAQELLKRAIQANKSCCRAWEYMGVIFEKEQAYKDAADCYENAWKLVNESDPAIGFKLAFNFLKARKLVQAIDICQKVLKAHPNYPKIRKDVLERARSMLKP